MINTQSSLKRQLLADFFTGKTETLREYKSKQDQIPRPYRWAVYHTTEAVKYLVNLDGNQTTLTDEEFDQLPNTSKFILIDYSAGSRIPAPDEP